MYEVAHLTCIWLGYFSRCSIDAGGREWWSEKVQKCIHSRFDWRCKTYTLTAKEYHMRTPRTRIKQHMAPQHLQALIAPHLQLWWVSSWQALDAASENKYVVKKQHFFFFLCYMNQGSNVKRFLRDLLNYDHTRKFAHYFLFKPPPIC